MVIYVVFSIICCLLAFLHDKLNNKIDKSFVYCFLFFIVFSFMGLRYGVGQDYFYTYVPSFQKISIYGYDSNVEYGWNLLNKFCSFIFDDYSFMFIVTAFIFVLFIFLSIKEYCTKIMLPIIIFIIGGYYFYSFNVMRQCITISMFIYSLKFAREKKIIAYMLINLIGASFHKSGYIYLPLYFVLNKNFDNRLYLILFLLVLFLRFNIVEYISKLLIGTKYENYLTGYYANTTSDSLTVSQIINIFMFALYTFLPRKDKIDKNGIIFKNVHFLGVVFTTFIGIIPLMFRMTTIFYLIQFISVPYFYKHHVKSKYKIIVLGLIAGIYVLLFTNTLINNGNGIIPYKFIWER